MNIEGKEIDSGDWEGEDLGSIVAGGIPKAMDLQTMGDLYFFLVGDLLSKHRNDSEVDTDFVVKTNDNGDWLSLEHFELHQSLFGIAIPDSLLQDYSRIFQEYFDEFPEYFKVNSRSASGEGHYLSDVRIQSHGQVENFHRRSENLSFLIDCLEMSSEKLGANSFAAHLSESCVHAVNHLKQFVIKSPQLSEDFEVPIRYIEEDDWEGASPEEPKN